MKFKLTESKAKKLNITKDDVIYVGVLGCDDLESIPDHILKFKDWYWAGDDSRVVSNQLLADAVDPFGSFGQLLVDEECEVRPVLDVRIPVKVGDTVNCFGLDWYCSNRYTSIGISTLFCMESVGQTDYNNRSVAANPLKYDESKLRKFVENWWNSVKEEPQIKFSLKIYKNTKLIDTLNSDDIEEITDRIDEEIANNNWVEFTNNTNDKVVKLTPDDFKD